MSEDNLVRALIGGLLILFVTRMRLRGSDLPPKEVERTARRALAEYMRPRKVGTSQDVTEMGEEAFVARWNALLPTVLSEFQRQEPDLDWTEFSTVSASEMYSLACSLGRKE